MAQITLDDLNKADKAAFVISLADIFEHSPWVAEAVQAHRPYQTLAALYEAMTSAVQNSGAEWQDVLIKGHPDLAGKAARLGTITTDSKDEQASAGLDRLSNEEFDAFHRLNDSYQVKFSFPFIVCVRRHSKDSILNQFAVRLKNDPAAERKAALNEIFRIAALRLDQRVTGPDRLKVSGRLSTHVLDTHAGRPAAGVVVELYEIPKSGTAVLITRAHTNEDGRSEKPLIDERPIPIGSYELRFAIGDYFARQKVPQTDPPFLGIVPVRFSVAEPEGHYHVPLLTTPWSFSTYRGS